MNPTPPTQVSCAQAEYERKKKRTRREVLLEKMEQVVPWARQIRTTAQPAARRGGLLHTSSHWYVNAQSRVPKMAMIMPCCTPFSKPTATR